MTMRSMSMKTTTVDNCFLLRQFTLMRCVLSYDEKRHRYIIIKLYFVGMRAEDTRADNTRAQDIRAVRFLKGGKQVC